MLHEDNSPLLTVREVASRLRISLATTYVLIKQGDIACCRIGGRRGAIRIREAELEAYLVGCETVVEQANETEQLSVAKYKHLRLL